MSDYTDDVACGLVCSWCGTFFREEHGYPVVCVACADVSSPQEMRAAGLQRAIREEI